MSKRAEVSADGAITIRIPMTFRKRGGRKRVVTPDGAQWAPRPRVDNAMVKAVARAFWWRRMLDEGVCATIEELAKREGVNRGYMSRVLRLTLLAPEIVEAVLDGRQPEGLRLPALPGGLRPCGTMLNRSMQPPMMTLPVPARSLMARQLMIDSIRDAPSFQTASASRPWGSVALSEERHPDHRCCCGRAGHDR